MATNNTNTNKSNQQAGQAGKAGKWTANGFVPAKAQPVHKSVTLWAIITGKA